MINPSKAAAPPPLWQRRWTGPAIVAAVFLALLIWTWQTWADVLVDFGVQLYVPWQITQGKVLYRDIAHYTGPLSIYYNALAFEIFGVSLRVLEFANFPILIGIVIVIYHIGAKLGDKLCATICAISFLVLFAFAHLTIAGNYNFVCPYEYEYTHGTLLGLLCVIFLSGTVTQNKSHRAFIAGLFAGLVFLTRTEFFAATVGATAVAFVLLLRVDWRRTLFAILFFAAGFFLPLLISAALLRLAMPMSMAIYRSLGMLPAVLRGNVSGQAFYTHSMGIDDLPDNLRQMALWSIRWCVPLAAFGAWATIRTKRKPAPAVLIALLIGAAFAGFHWKSRPWWVDIFRPLPAAVAIIAAISFVRFMAAKTRQSALVAILAVFSLILLAKVFFYARIFHYGVWLAMPAVIVVLAASFGLLPTAIRRHGGNPGVFTAGLGGIWIVVLLVHLSITQGHMRPLDIPVGSGADRFLADNPRAEVVNNAILLAQQLPPGKTLTCFPEGIMINYLARRQTSTRYVNFNPPDLLLFGEDNMLRALQNSPPDFIFIVHKDTREFGERFFGQDYGQKLFAWIQSHYVEVLLPPGLNLGDEPLRDSHFGIRLWAPRPTGEPEQRMIQGAGDEVRYSLTADSTSTRE